MKQQNQNFIVINGRTYDARSGLQIQHAKSALNKKVFSDIAPAGPQKIPPHATLAQRKPLHVASSTSGIKRQAAHVVAKKLHRSPQRAHTLQRTGVQRPQIDATLGHVRPQVGEQKLRQHNRVQRIHHAPQAKTIHLFAASDVRPSAAEIKAPAPTPVVKPSLTLSQLQSHMPNKPTPVASTAPALAGSDLKEHLIQQRLAETPTSRQEKFQEHQHKVNSFFSKQPRFLSAIAGTLGVLLLVAYVTFLNMPGISLRIAASRAGFAAAMPGYTPSGYSLNGPVNYSPGQVSLMFGSNTNGEGFNLMQKQSNWDTQALLDNHVAKKTDNYLTYQEKGLTIFMYDGKASWVNGGVWYSIDGTAKLSSDQILKIATSM